MESYSLCDCNISTVNPSIFQHSQNEFNKYILNQVEFYFSDSNLLNDSYMKSLIWKTRKGFVPLKILCKFQKIKETFQAAMISSSKYIETLGNILKDSKNLKLNILKNQVKRIKRFSIVKTNSPPVFQERQKRTLYVEGLNEFWGLLDIYKNFVEFGQIVKVDLPRYLDKRNKTYCFIEYANEQFIEQILEKDDIIQKRGFKCLSMVDFNLRKNDYLQNKLRALVSFGYTTKAIDSFNDGGIFLVDYKSEIGRINRGYIKAVLRQIGVTVSVLSFDSTKRKFIVSLRNLEAANFLINFDFKEHSATSFITQVTPLGTEEITNILDRLKTRGKKSNKNKNSEKSKKIGKKYKKKLKLC